MILKKLTNNAAFKKTIKNVRKHREIRLITTEVKRNYLVSEPNYHTTTFFRKFISHTNKKSTDTNE